MEEYKFRYLVTGFTALFSVPLFSCFSYYMLSHDRLEDFIASIAFLIFSIYVYLRDCGLYTVNEREVSRKFLWINYSFKFSELKEVVISDSGAGNHTFVFISGKTQFVLPSIPYIQGRIKRDVESLVISIIERKEVEVRRSFWADFYRDKNCKP